MPNKLWQFDRPWPWPRSSARWCARNDGLPVKNSENADRPMSAMLSSPSRRSPVRRSARPAQTVPSAAISSSTTLTPTWNQGPSPDASKACRRLSWNVTKPTLCDKLASLRRTPRSSPRVSLGHSGTQLNRIEHRWPQKCWLASRQSDGAKYLRRVLTGPRTSLGDELSIGKKPDYMDLEADPEWSRNDVSNHSNEAADARAAYRRTPFYRFLARKVEATIESAVTSRDYYDAKMMFAVWQRHA